MKETKQETFLYEGLGFPVLMINVPMKKVLGEWVMNINFAELQRVAMLALAKKNVSLTGKEVRSIRHYLNMSTHKFAEELGVSHVAILNWESEERKMNADTEIHMRLYILNYLKVTDKEFRKIYNQFDRKVIAKRHFEQVPLEIDVEKIAC
jgi:DNA-binding transcriptional regulator YiaG